MSSTLGFTLSEKYAAKHRSTPETPLTTSIARRVRSAAVFSGVAMVATGLAVSTGVLSHSAPVGGSAAALSASTSPAKGLSQDELEEREERASRSADDRRPQADRAKARALSSDSGVANTKSEDLS